MVLNSRLRRGSGKDNKKLSDKQQEITESNDGTNITCQGAKPLKP